MRIRVWRYPSACFSRPWTSWMRLGDLGPVHVRTVTVDLDETDDPPLLAWDSVRVRRSSGGKGLHLSCRLEPTRSYSPVECLTLRELLGDDPLRLKMDAYRWSVTRDPHYLRGILFDRKRGQSAGQWTTVQLWRLRRSRAIPRTNPRRVVPRARVRANPALARSRRAGPLGGRRPTLSTMAGLPLTRF